MGEKAPWCLERPALGAGRVERMLPSPETFPEFRDISPPGASAVERYLQGSMKIGDHLGIGLQQKWETRQGDWMETEGDSRTVTIAFMGFGYLELRLADVGGHYRLS